MLQHKEVWKSPSLQQISKSFTYHLSSLDLFVLLLWQSSSPDWSLSAAEHLGSLFLPFAVPAVSSQLSARHASPPVHWSRASALPPLHFSPRALPGSSAGTPQPLWHEPGAHGPPALSPSGCLALPFSQISQLPDIPPVPDTPSLYVPAFQTGSMKIGKKTKQMVRWALCVQGVLIIRVKISLNRQHSEIKLNSLYTKSYRSVPLLGFSKLKQLAW